MTGQKLIEGYFKKIRALEKDLKELEAQAKSIKEAWDKKADAEKEIHNLRQHIGYLQGQRQDLLGEYTRASFEGDSEKLAEIQQRRQDIDSEIEECHKKIEEQKQVARSNTPDRQLATELAVDLDLLSAPNVFLLIKELESLLHKQSSELRTRIQNARNNVRGVDQDLYHDIRHEKDHTHKSSAQRAADEQKSKERREQRELERQRLAAKLNTPKPVGSGTSKKNPHHFPVVVDNW